MPRRVLYVAWAPFFSGAERALLLTVTNLDRARYEPYVVVGTEGELAAQLRAAGVSVDVCPIRYLDVRHPLAWMSSVARLWRIARQRQPHVFHGNDVISYQPAGYVARLMRRPSLTHVRFPDDASGFDWFLRSGFTRAIFMSRALEAESVTAAPGIFAGRSDVVYDGVAIPTLPDPATRAARRLELNLPPDQLAVALTGQVAVVKGIWEFVDAAARLTATDAPLTFVVLGDDQKGHGVLRREMEDRVRALGLSSRFRFLGFRPNAPEILPAFDIVAVPSHVEPMGNATIEAMAAGLPVVGSRVGGIPESVVDGVTGLLVAPRDGAALADAITRLARRPDERRTMGTEGRRRAQDVFGLGRHRDAIQAVYDRVLGGPDLAHRQ